MRMNRFDDLHRKLELLANSKQRDVAKRYAKLLKDINSLLAKQYEKYEKQGKLTYEEMAKHKRLEKLLKQVNEQINNSDAGLRSEIHAFLREQYKESYYQSAWILETSSEARLAYTKLKDEVIDSAIITVFTGLTLNERLSKRRSDLIYHMRETITRGLVEGQTYGQMSRDIKKVLEGDLAKANRIVRTESKRIRETGALNSVKHAQSKGIIMKKKWNSVQDERVRSNHKALNGVVLDIDELFEVDGHKAEAPTLFGVASEDINCRCFLSYEVVGVEKPIDNTLADLSYAEWQKERLS